jgi:8-oxo-dGTP pyrophosphatase MutT (NUDIX family)
MYCNNCGDKGHVFRTCPDPVISCGILFLRGIYEPLELPVDSKTLSVLMVRRKDSMSYMEFIRGKYELHNSEYLKRQVSNMTIHEQKLIITEKFETLWFRLWGSGRDTESVEYENARNKFNSLDRNRLVAEAPSPFIEPEWGFPKGRRMRGESDIQCAIREYFEETNIPSDSYTIREDLTFTETFTGTNNIKYKHIYFVALLKNSKLIHLEQKLTPVQRREVSSVAWKTLAECKNITRPHYVERKKMITDLERIVSLASK